MRKSKNVCLLINFGEYELGSLKRIKVGPLKANYDYASPKTGKVRTCSKKGVKESEKARGSDMLREPGSKRESEEAQSSDRLREEV